MSVLSSLPGLPAGVLSPLLRFPAAALPLRRSHVPRDLESVTTRAEEAPPGAGGLTEAGVERIWGAVESLYRWGMHPAIALCVRRDGEVVLDRAIGHARGNGPDDDRDAETEPATPETPFVLASASKSVTAMIVHLLDQRGLLHVDDRVCDYIPEFARQGKDMITINHVLSHRAGVPHIPRNALDVDRLGDRDYIVDVLCDAKPRWRAGRSVGYHAVTGGFILGEIVERVTGKTLDAVLQAEVSEPLGFRWLRYGTDPDDAARVAESHATGLPVLPPLSTLLQRAFGVTVREAVELLGDPRMLDGIVPSANVVATANEASRFFELLRRGGTLDGVTVFEPRTIGRAVSEQSYMEIDLTLGLPFRYGMGFMLGARTFSLYGPGTERAFGHLGFTNIITWADPERRLSGALLTSGKPVLGPHLYDLWNVMRTIAEVCPQDGPDRWPS